MTKIIKKKIKCDRCGKEFDDIDPLHRPSWVKPTLMYMKIKFFAARKNKVMSREMVPYDLCRDCAESFVDWFTEKKNNSETVAREYML